MTDDEITALGAKMHRISWPRSCSYPLTIGMPCSVPQ